MVLLWLPLGLIATGFMLLGCLRMTRVLAIRFRGGTHPSKDFDFIAVNLIVGFVLMHAVATLQAYA